MDRNPRRADIARLGHVLADVDFPAAKWQLVTHAENYGADATTRDDLWRLPAGEYADLVAVLVALGYVVRAASAPPPGYRTQPATQAAAGDRPRPEPRS